MTAQASIYGRLGQDARAIQTRTGTPMTVTSIAVDLGENDGPPTWFGIVAFGQTAEKLLAHGKGDLISVSGRLQLHRYTTRNGEEREQFQVVADTVISARTVRPGGRKRAKPSEHRGELTP